MPTLREQIEKNLQQIELSITEACARSGRARRDVQLITVTKYADPEWVTALLELGYHDLGESRPQQLSDRAEHLPETTVWHLIGQLQRNKVRKVLPYTNLIHSVDSLKLVRAIDRISEEEGFTPSLLLQVNTSGEQAKQGFTPEELLSVWDEIENLSHVKICGLMTMAPKHEDIEKCRPDFRSLRELRGQLSELSNKHNLHHLSMGMSRDYEIAIEEGATLIRVGSSLFAGLETLYTEET